MSPTFRLHRGAWFQGRLATLLLGLALTPGLLGLASVPTAASEAPEARKAVIISGPVGGLTSDYLAMARRIANQAEAQGMDVRRVFHPRATWARVLRHIQGAHLVIYLGHGNGWPSPHGPFQERTKNGFGLNPYAGAGPHETLYKGADRIREKVRLAPDAVVVLYRACYSAGNGEAWHGPEWDRSIATKRVDNFAAGFLAVGAGAVFAFGQSQVLDIPRTLATSNRTMDQIFMQKGISQAYADGFLGWDDYYRSSSRTPGALIHLDPHPVRGHLRAASGDLTLTAAEWRGEPPREDSVPPTLSNIGILANGQFIPASDEAPAFSPNGDGVDERIRVARTVSEPSYIEITVRDESGTRVRQFLQWGRRGEGISTWDGRRASGTPVPDGLYRLTLRARDVAGNLSEPRSVEVRVLTTLRSYRASRSAIHVSDGDALARSTGLSVHLSKQARVVWRVRDRAGDLVRTLREDDAVAPGKIVARWNGTDDQGLPVPDGWYRAVIAATTPDGVVRYDRRVWVGAYRVKLSDPTPRRGQRISVTLTASEPLEGPPRLRIEQPGLDAYGRTTQRVSGSTYRATFTLKSGGTQGRLRITIKGTDTGGGKDEQVESVRLR